MSVIEDERPESTDSTVLSFATEPPRSLPVRGAAPESLIWVSWLRIVAMAAVVLIHVAGLTAIAPDARQTPVGRVAIGLDFASRWAVPVFVLLSGALLLDPARYRGPGDFLRRRALRLVPAVIFWHLVYLVFIALATDRTLTPGLIVRQILTGKLWTALYFFWIVLGLALITPLLIGWVASASQRAQLVAGALLATIGPLCLVTVPVRQAPFIWLETAWTWWIPYLGYYLLGYALRDVVLRRGGLLFAVVVAAGGSALLSWQWRRRTGLAGVLEHQLPAASYYSPVLVLIAIAIFLIARSVIRPDGLLGALCRPGPAQVARRLGDTTLGVFGVHLLILKLVLALPWLGGANAADSVVQLVGRCLAVFLIAYLLVLVGARVPLLRRVL